MGLKVRKFFKKLDKTRAAKHAANKLGLSKKKIKRFFKELKTSLRGGTALNSASATGAVIPSHVGRSVTDMY